MLAWYLVHWIYPTSWVMYWSCASLCNNFEKYEVVKVQLTCTKGECLMWLWQTKHEKGGGEVFRVMKWQIWHVPPRNYKNKFMFCVKVASNQPFWYWMWFFLHGLHDNMSNTHIGKILYFTEWRITTRFINSYTIVYLGFICVPENQPIT